VNGLQCDNCREFTTAPATGWLVIFQQLDPALAANPFQAAAITIGSFCSFRCVGEYAYVRSGIAEQPTGE
jgi:hypothetical protein